MCLALYLETETNAHVGPDEYYSLGITVDKPGIEVRTRTGYYAQP
jgi:hypothetical protein